MFAIYFDMVSLVFSHVFSQWTILESDRAWANVVGRRHTCRRSACVGGARVFSTWMGHNPVVVIMTRYLVKTRHHENRLRPNEVW